MSHSKKSLADYISQYPESVLVRWLESKEKAHLRAKDTPSDELLANRKLKDYTPEMLDILRKKFI